MAENVILKLLLKGGEKAEADVKKLNKNLSDTTKELDDAKNNFSLFGVSVGDVKGKFKELKGIAAGVLKKIAIQAKLAGGGLKMMFGGKMAGGAKVLFNVIKTGVAATGIGLLVVAFAGLVQYFRDSEAGASKFKQITAQLGVVVGNVTDIISNLGKAVFKLMTGDVQGFKDGLAEVTQGVKDFGATTKKEMAAANQLEKDRLELQRFEREAIVDKAKTEAKMMELRLKSRDDEKFTNEQRLGFMREANKLADEQLAKDLKVAEEKLRFQQVENSFSKSTQENLDAEAALKARVFEIQKANFSERKRMKSEEQALVKEGAAIEKAAEKEKQDAIDAGIKATKEAAAKKKAIDDKALADKEALALSEGEKLLAIQQENALLLIEDANERALAQIEIDRENALNSVADTEHTEAMKAAINEKYNKKKQDQNKATSDAERKLGIGDLGAVASVLGSMASLQQEGTDGWKTTKIAEARINSFMSASSAYSAMAGIPVIGPALGIIAAGAALVSGQKQVEQIKATEIPKMARGGVVGGYGNGTSDSVNAKLSRGEVVINAKSAKMFRGALSNMNVAGGGVGFARGGATTPSTGAGISGLSTEPLKAFVITDELSDSQAKLAKIRRRSKL